MSHTNSTTNYNLPQFVGTDTPGWLTDVNGAMSDIDAAIYARQQSIATNANNITALDGRVANAETSINTLDDAINDPATGIAARLTSDEATIANNTTNIAANTASIGSLSTLITNLAADDVSYDNTGSGMTATDVQNAIDELAGRQTVLPVEILSIQETSATTGSIASQNTATMNITFNAVTDATDYYIIPVNCNYGSFQAGCDWHTQTNSANIEVRNLSNGSHTIWFRVIIIATKNA